MIFQKSLKMAPIMLAFASASIGFSNTKISFNESDVNKNLIKREFLDVDKLIKSFEHNDIYIEKRVRHYYDKWVRQTILLSDISKIINNRNFQLITSMGSSAIPAILKQVKEGAVELVWALNIITGLRISNLNLSLDEAAKKWIKWGIKNHFLLNS